MLDLDTRIDQLQDRLSMPELLGDREHGLLMQQLEELEAQRSETHE